MQSRISSYPQKKETIKSLIIFHYIFFFCKYPFWVFFLLKTPIQLWNTSYTLQSQDSLIS